MSRESPLHQHSTSSILTFSFPIDINFSWPCKSVTHSYQYKYWNILNFTTIQLTSKFLKSIHSYQYNYRTFYFSIWHTFLYSPTQLLEHFYFFCLLIQLLNFSIDFLSFNLHLCVLSFPCNHMLNNLHHTGDTLKWGKYFYSTLYEWRS